MGLKAWIPALLLTLLGYALNAQYAGAQARTILPAPPPDEAQGAWLDNEVTKRFVQWQRLDRDWQALKATPRSASFARRAADICLTVAELPREGEGEPERRTRLLDETCSGAINALPDCYRENANRDKQGWAPGFERKRANHLREACGDATRLEAVTTASRKRSGAAWPESVQVILSAERRDLARASSGKSALAHDLCGRVEALAHLLRKQAAPSRAARSLAESKTAATLTAQWSKLSSAGATFEEVVALHLAQARIELYGKAIASADLLDAGITSEGAKARAAFSCLKGFRDASARLRAVDRALVKAERGDTATRPIHHHKEQRPQEIRYEAPPPQRCCKVCRRGYACGDSCISRSKSCHKGPGCACDG